MFLETDETGFHAGIYFYWANTPKLQTALG
jgi:hypothetical protein